MPNPNTECTDCGRETAGSCEDCAEPLCESCAIEEHWLLGGIERICASCHRDNWCMEDHPCPCDHCESARGERRLDAYEQSLNWRGVS